MENLMRFTPQQLPRLSALVLSAAIGSAHAAVGGLDITGSATSAQVGSNAQLTIEVNLAEPLLVDGLQVLFDFNPAALQFDSALSDVGGISWSTLVSLAGPGADTDASDGQLGFAALLPTSTLVPAGVFTATLVFNGLAVGSHRVDYSLELATDLGESSLSGSNFTNVAITPVPEPTPTALLLGGLAMLGWLAKRRAA
jgi:hypothetical protein